MNYKRTTIMIIGSRLMAKTTSKQSPRLTLSYCEKKVNLCYNEVKRYRKDDDLCLVVTARLSLMTPAGI
jgi:hypothetical protein